MSAMVNRLRLTGTGACTEFCQEGDRLRQQGDYPGAEGCYIQAIRAISRPYPGRAVPQRDLPLGEAWLKLSELYHEMDKPHQAEQCFLESLRIFAETREDRNLDLARSLERALRLN